MCLTVLTALTSILAARVEELTKAVEHELITSRHQVVVALDVLGIAILHVDAIPELKLLACLCDDGGSLRSTNHHSIFDEPVATHH